jgi:hypothetical protein
MLSFAIVYFFESGLFNGLQSIQTKKILLFLKLASRLRSDPAKAFLALLSHPGGRCSANAYARASGGPARLRRTSASMPAYAGTKRRARDSVSQRVTLAPTVAQSGDLKSIALISILRNELIFAYQGPGALRPSSERGPDALFQAPPTELGGPSSSAKSASART